MAKKKEEVLEITFKGLLSLTIQDAELVQAVIDDLELYLRRHKMKDGGYGAVIFDGKQFIMTSVERGE
jgi:hypothetical protein